MDAIVVVVGALLFGGIAVMCAICWLVKEIELWRK